MLRKKQKLLFGRRNYKIMLIGLAFILIGFILMVGGGSKDPNVFDESIYNFRRIRLSPTIILIGFGIQIYAILTSSKKHK